MANVKISALPSTTTSTFNDWLVKNNSGETTTSKVQLKNVLGMTSLNGNNAIQSSSWLTNLGTTASTESAIAIGNGAEATSPYSIAIGFEARNNNRDGTRDYYTCIGYQTRSVQGGTAIGKSAEAAGADSTAIGQSARASGNGGFSLGNNSESRGQQGIAFGGFSNDYSDIGGIAIGNSAWVDNSSNYSIALGTGSYITGSTLYATAIGFEAVVHKEDGVAIGRSAFAKHDDAVVLGAFVESKYSATTHTENSHTNKVKSFDVINGGSVGGGVVDVDLSLGTLFIFTMTGDTSPNFINWREGQQIQFWVVNTSNYAVPAATISGGGDVYAKAGTISPTNNATSGYYGTIINGDLYLDEHLNFQVV